MDTFQSEQTRLDKRIDEVLSQLEDIGFRGYIIGKNLHLLRTTLKCPELAPGSLLESEESKKGNNDCFAEIKKELLTYSEKSAILLEHVTKVLTEIRYDLVWPILIAGITQLHYGPLEALVRAKFYCYALLSSLL